MVKWLISNRLNFSMAALVWFALVSVSAVAQQGQFVAGRDYVVIETPVRTADSSKIEVTEVFWYGCGHCNNFRPVFDQWKKQQSQDITVQHSPAMWNRGMATHAQIYYTAKVLGKDEAMHKNIFDAIHLQNKRLLKTDQIYSLFAEQGVDRDKFDKTFKSFGVKSMVQQADARARGYGITGTPELVINGKYRTSASLTGSQRKMLQVADYLISKERAALGDKS